MSPAFMLSDAGYDVWLGNNRGSKHSLKHIKYNSKQYEFWDYTSETMGLYDIKAQIDFIL